MKKTILIVGIICILFLYTIPVPIYPPPHPVLRATTYLDYSTMQIKSCPDYSFLTISQLSGSVSEPIVMGSVMGGLSVCTTIIGGMSYALYTGLFFAIWIIGILCVLYGFSK